MSTSPPTDQQQQIGNMSRGAAISISSEVMVAAIIFLFVVIVFVFFLHLYAKMRWGRLAADARRSRLVFAANQDPTAARRRGLDPAVIDSLPVSIYRTEEFKATGGLECAVCLSELAEGEKARILPRCNHGFHLDCINMWFHSHSTCPLCRRPVGPDGDLEAAGDDSQSPEAGALTPDTTGSPILPTNVLFWGTQDQVSSREAAPAAAEAVSSGSSSSYPGKLEGALVIEIPRSAGMGFSSPHTPLPSSTFPLEDMKSPATAPTPSRLKSFRRLLSRGKKVVGPSCSPRDGGDIEQGMGGSGVDGGVDGGAPPRTPTSNS